MKLTIKCILAAMLVAALAGTVAVAWLAGTTEGARWLLESVSRHTPLKITAQVVEGRLLDHLRLTGVRLALPQQEVEIESLDLRWQALLLLSGKVGVEELSLRGVLVRDNTPPSRRPPDLTWPRVSGRVALLAGRIGRLRVDGLSYRRPGEQPLEVTHLSTSLSWRDAILTLRELNVVSASGRMAGTLEAGFHKPSLRLDLNVTPTRPVAEMDHFSLKARLIPVSAPEQLAGRFEVTGGTAVKGRLEMVGVIGMTRNSFSLSRLSLSAPGRRGTVSGEGNILLTATQPDVKLRLKIDGLDLAPELKVPSNISGDLSFEGNPSSYRGRFDLANQGKGWRAARVSGMYQGTAEGLDLAPLNGVLLGGTLQGRLAVGWRDGFSLNGTLKGRNLDPAKLSPDWKGVVNLDLSGNLAKSATAPLWGRVSGTLLESSLHGQSLTGDLLAELADDNLRISRLALQGKGFSISAAGELTRRLAFSARISDFSRLVPESEGELTAEGWLRRRKGLLSGSVTARGRNLAAEKVRIGAVELTAGLAEGRDHPLHVSAALRKVVYDRFQADSATLAASGTALRHTLDVSLRSSGADLQLALAGAYKPGSWQGEIARLSGRDSVGPWSLQAPANLAVTSAGISLSPLVVTGVQPERLEVAGEMRRQPLSGLVRARWEGLNLARAGHWFKDAAITGSCSGNAQLHLLGEERLTLAGSATATGTFTADGHRVNLRQGSLNLDWNEHGLRGGVDLELAEAGRLRATIASSEPGRPALPEKGEAAAEWSGIDLVLLRPWLPPAIRLDGHLSGNVAVMLLPEHRLELRGTSTLAGGKATWRRQGGELNVELRNAKLAWNWQGETLRGDLALTLAEYGQVRGNFQLPLPARLPAVLDPKGPVEASLTGQVRETGLLTALFPGFIQESHGDIDLDLRAAGQWEDPLLTGELRLAKAGAYLPTAGIRVKDVQLTAKLARDAVNIDSFRAVSGPGHIEGTAVVQLKKWQPAGYRGSMNGDRFQLAYLPELQLLATPRLTFEGVPEKLTVRGEVRLPELVVTGPPARAPVAPSSDVIIAEAPPAKKAPSLDLDLQIGVVLGDRVLIKVEGIDAQLGGMVDLKVRGPGRIASSGEIRVVKGRYKTYGINLEIVRGRVFYAGGSIDQPTLDILALRTVNEVRAGVTVGGTPRAPVVKLYSEPAMPDVDILAYIVLGHPLGSSGEQAGLVAKAAGFLLSSGQSVVLQDQIKNRLGLSTLEIQAGGAGTTGRMGYKPIAVTPPGTAPQPATTGLSQAMVTVGKYLTPKLYVSYGQSVFTRSNMIRLKYEISRRWEVETQTGTESGADLYYKIDFN